MIRYFRLKSIGKQAKIGHRNKCGKVVEEVEENKGKEIGHFTIKEIIRVVEHVHPCREGTPHNKGVHIGARRGVISAMCKFVRGNAKICPRVLF